MTVDQALSLELLAASAFDSPQPSLLLVDSGIAADDVFQPSLVADVASADLVAS